MCEHENREVAMTVTHRDKDGTPTVWCDPCIAPIVRALNDSGHTTVASCCGHHHHPGWISLADGRELIIADKEWDEAITGFIHDEVGCKPGRECENCAADRQSWQ